MGNVVNSCMRNCRGRPNVHEAIALKITSSLQPIVSTEWSVNPAINWKRDTGSGNSRQFLSIYENVLQPGTKYNVTATGKSSWRNSSNDEYKGGLNLMNSQLCMHCLHRRAHTHTHTHTHTYI